MDAIGHFDQRITIKRIDTRTSDAAGGYTQTLTTLATVWAKVEPGTGREQVEAERVAAEAVVIFTIRNRSDLTLQPDDRIEWDGETYNIRLISNAGGRRMFLELLAERGVAL